MPPVARPPRRARLARAATLAAALAFCATGPAASGQTPFEAGPQGALLQAPERGLRHRAEPAVHLGDVFAEWFGVSFDGPLGPVSAAGRGALPDWAQRMPVRVKSFQRSASGAMSLTQAGNLEIRTEFYAPPGSDAVIVSVILKNKGFETLRNIVYTREWQLPETPGRDVHYDRDGRHVQDAPTHASGAVPPAPPNVTRVIWAPKDLKYKQSAGKTFVFSQPNNVDGDGMLPELDVKLSLWTDPNFPDGLPIGLTNGVSFFDYDGDGWIDIFAAESANLWRNLNGTTWELAANLEGVLPDALIRYGSSFADYDNDGDADVATEPRNVGLGLDRCMHLLKNLGGSNFVDVSSDPTIVMGNPCDADSETICWGDVNGDGLLDLFLPVYPPWALFPGPGNFFLLNQGLSNNEFRFTEMATAAGLDNPVNTSRPEGAQMCDYDRDGDLDLFSNGTLYQNASTLTQVDFDDVTGAAGIGLRDALDEGVMFIDYDNDGDLDLIVSYLDPAFGNRIWESRGDGTFFLADAEIMINWFQGVGLGLSAADWDNDGDIDITTRQVLRRNMFMETGTRSYVQAINLIAFNHLTSATPAWGDWDRDGDIDTALGNWIDEGHFYNNDLYGPGMPAARKRHVRVRVVRDGNVPDGLETEYGASVELHVAGEEETGIRRRQFLASGHGYLNQNEYVLHFALPADPLPADPSEDVHFDLSVDFPGLPEDGFWRVDKHTNTALGDINLATLVDREITVFRSGKAIVNGNTTSTEPSQWPRLVTTNGGQPLPSPGAGLAAPERSPGPSWWTGVEIDTTGLPAPVRIREILLDGQLDTPATCATPFNIGLWEFNGGAQPELVTGSELTRTTDPRNHRTSVRTDLRLKPNRIYRLVARVTELRTTPLVDDGAGTGVVLTGGLSFADPTPCSSTDVSAAIIDPNRVPLTLRYSTLAPNPWEDLGNGLGGLTGLPALDATGWLAASSPLTLALTNARPGAAATLVVGFSAINAPFKGGVLVPAPALVLSGLPINGAGSLILPALWPAGVPSGFPLLFQYWIQDAAGTLGWAASNALGAVTQ